MWPTCQPARPLATIFPASRNTHESHRLSHLRLPHVLKYEEVEKPIPGDNEVLIKVCAGSVNPLDYHLMRGRPYLVRLISGLRKPRLTRPGVDVAGLVEAVGRNVTQIKPGDEVFGSCRGRLCCVCVYSRIKVGHEAGQRDV